MLRDTKGLNIGDDSVVEPSENALYCDFLCLTDPDHQSIRQKEYQAIEAEC